MKTHLLTLILCFLSASVIAQDPVIMKINGKDIKKSEFDYIYNKNNNEDVVDKKTLEEYVELFKNFKLKVAEAEDQGIDTLSSFKKELADYRAQLAKPYLSNPTPDESLIQTEYDRMNELVEVAHIMVLFPQNVVNNQSVQILPADTVEAYKKISQVYSLLQKKKDFSALVREYSEDRNSKDAGIPGYIGWVSGMMLTPSLEDAAFSIEVGKFSKPVRTSYGYHIVKVLNKKPNPGQIHASHILRRFPENATDEQKKEIQGKMNEIYQKVLNGEDFAELAREYSEDGSASRGGDLGWFGYGAMVKEFENASFGLSEINDVSKPFASPFGYHIVKLLDRKPVDPIETKREEIVSKLSNGGFFNRLYKPGIEELKKQNDFEKNEEAYNSLMLAAVELFPLNELYIEKFADSDQTLFSAGGRNIPVSEFISYMQKKGRSQHWVSVDFLVEKLEAFEYDQLLEAENLGLEKKYPEFRNLMQEYHDGILMFEISNKEVWNRASEDVEGLENFFKQTQKDYTWNEPHYKGYVVLVKDADTKKKIQKEIKKMKPEAAVEYMLENYKVGTVSYVKIEKNLYKKGDNPYVDEAVFKGSKVTEYPENFQTFFVMGKTIKSPESYVDVRGQVITAYQDYLEEQWLKKLNEKYPVEIYKDALFIKK
ncbi:peptidylprolyl isomerase [Bacteroidales bacterium OttesenSCG-928-A17]|nr:peptidylprolyl isomerase [Bacteroidales bacterium OttesenSCG-928-A17]